MKKKTPRGPLPLRVQQGSRPPAPTWRARGVRHTRRQPYPYVDLQLIELPAPSAWTAR